MNKRKQKEYILILDEIPNIITKITKFFQIFNNSKPSFMKDNENSDKCELGQFKENNFIEEKNGVSGEIMVKKGSNIIIEISNYPKKDIKKKEKKKKII